MSSYNNVTKTDGNVRLTSLKNLALILNNIKSLLPLNLIRINKIYLFDILDSHHNFFSTQIQRLKNFNIFYFFRNWFFLELMVTT